ncbi:di/tricarboxylate transporter [Rubrivivax gelatinosus]|uniref:Di/tricarboxylate transporter n=2 Tax=Rubrivivax gelatinosus TaxID=28068 RepID=A0A4R2MEW7_RUBGE|nr:SLC13 family permease [Rubrivivax gelatinosus]MBK1688051.1 SLC13 family permease [Rubrivivax gelatinosus]TCP03775.1 di/tricarboxylate transporter [Rubrivivax gelatinosus]
MTPETAWVLALLAVCVVCFVLNRPRMDVVALAALTLLVLGGTLTLPEALAGFSEPGVILIALFFVIGEALARTGIAYRVGDWLVARAGGREARLLALLMAATAALGSVMSSTAVVAIFVPVALRVAQRAGSAPGRLMMPLAFAGLLSGMLTLVGTPPNLVVQAELQRRGHEGFGFFDFTPMGAVLLVLGIGYMLVARRWLAAREAPRGGGGEGRRRRLRELAADYGLLDRTRRLRVPAASPAVGRTLGELELRARHGANVIAIERERGLGPAVVDTSAHQQILPGDVLLADFAAPDGALQAQRVVEAMGFTELPFRRDYFSRLSREIGLAELLVPPGAAVIGQSILELRMRSQRGINVIGLRRGGRLVDEDPLHTKLKMGDTLLVAGAWKDIRGLAGAARDFVVLTLPAELDDVAPAASRAPLALAVLAATVALMVSGLVPNVVAALLGCLAMGAVRCIDAESAYRAIHWQSLMLIVGMLPFAVALQKTGGITWLVDVMLAATGEASPRAALAGLFVLTALVGLFVSNTATAVLMAPIGLGLADRLGCAPEPFAMMVALAASAAFMTPVSSPVNTLVLGPGRYRFVDFVKIGVPFTAVVGVVCVLLLPVLFPF